MLNPDWYANVNTSMAVCRFDELGSKMKPLVAVGVEKAFLPLNQLPLFLSPLALQDS